MRRKKRAKKKSAIRRVARKRRTARRAAAKKVLKKKAGKKKATKKKAAKKKAAKKAASGGGGGGGGGGGKRTTVLIDPKKTPSSKKPRLSRSKGHRIRWKNEDAIDHYIHFVPGEWPFGGTQHDILAPADGTSETVTVRSDAIRMQYDYEIIPEVEYDDPGTSPDGPAVIIDD